MAEDAGKINHYVCKACHGRTCTINLHEGVTPFSIECLAAGPCQSGELDAFRSPNGRGMAYSQFYNVPQKPVDGVLGRPFVFPTHEWYKPEPNEVLANTSEEAHVKNGGLLLRPISPDTLARFGLVRK